MIRRNPADVDQERAIHDLAAAAMFLWRMADPWGASKCGSGSAARCAKKKPGPNPGRPR